MRGTKFNLKINNNVFLKNPNSSELGGRIISGSIDLIDELGFENFTFKKLAKKVATTEASVYRYFESKHHVLIYLVIWYWSWQQYRLTIRLANVEDPKERLKRAIILLSEKIEIDSEFSTVNEIKLNRIVISESSKIYMNKMVHKDNELGFFVQYKEIVEDISSIILEINQNYKYPHMLISTVIEGANHQRFFLENLPRLTDLIEGEDSITNFYVELVLNSLDI